MVDDAVDLPGVQLGGQHLQGGPELGEDEDLALGIGALGLGQQQFVERRGLGGALHAVGQVGQAQEVGVVGGQPSDRGQGAQGAAGGGGRTARLPQERAQAEAVGAGQLRVAQHAPAEGGDFVVEALFVGEELQVHRVGPARGQLQADLAPGMAHHYIAQQLAQVAPVLGQAWVAPHHELALELFGAFQLPGLEHGDQVVEFAEAVLHRRGREQQDEALLQLVDQLPRDRGPVLQVMRLVDDDQVVEIGGDHLAVFGPACGGQRSDHPREVSPGVRAQAAEGLVVGGDKVEDIELGGQLLAPLLDQPGRRQDQHALHHLAQQVFLEHQAGLDGLAQPHLVAEQPPAVEAAQGSAGGPDLVVEGREADGVQGEQVVEAGDQRQPLGHQLEAIGLQIHPWRDSGQDLRRARGQRKARLDRGG